MTAGSLSGLSKSFIPVSYIASASIVMFIAGLAGSLTAGIWAVGILTAALIGLVIFLTATSKIPAKALTPDTSLIFFIAAVIWLWLATRNAAVIHTDYFSH